MKKNLTPLFLLLFSFAVSAQNLVVNPSFEQTITNCANLGGEGFFADLDGSWGNASNNTLGDSCSSPDLFSACNTIFGNPSPTNMPNSVLGYQNSRTGTRHAGIITHEALDEYREYLQGHTTAPLQAGVSYCVSMYVSLGNDVVYATDNMGVYFTNTPYLRDPCPGTTSSLISVTPQLNYDCAPITDTTDAWFRLQWNYVATGGEQYFTIGNFYNNANTNVITVGGGFTNPYAYYYIDDVSIIATNACCYADIPPAEVVCLDDVAFNLTATGGVGSSCSGTVSGSWTGTGITNATNGTFDPTVAGIGTHTLTYTMTCGYTATTSVIVSGCAALTVCQEANGDLTVNGGTGPYTWNEETIIQDCSACFFGCDIPSGCAVDVPTWTSFTTGTTVTPPGTYPIQVTDNDGGSLTITGLAGVPLCSGAPCDLEVQLVTSQDACNGVNNGSATVTPVGNVGTVGYVWNSVPVQNGATVSGLTAGEYIVTATDQQGCENTLTVVISNELVTADAGEDAIICKGETATLSATGGASYLWDNSAGTDASVIVDPGATTTYTVTVTGAGGCADTDEVTVTVYNTPLINFVTQSTTVCNNAGSIQLAGNPSGGTFSGPGVSGNMFNPATAGVGTHILIYEYYEQQECPAEDQITITVDVCTSIEDGDDFEGLTIHPNPSNGLFVLQYSGDQQGLVDIEVTDMVGRTVLNLQLTELNEMKVELNMVSLDKGYYMVRITQNGNQLGSRLLTKL